jgi:hypothetical protein
MTVSPSIPATIEIRRSRLFGGALVVAAAAAGLTWALLAFAFDTDSTSSAQRSNTGGTTVGVVQQAEQYGRGLSNVGMLAASPSTSSAALDAQRVPSIMSLTPARLAAGALGTGYALPTVHRGPTVASVLASMSPQTRRYTKAVMALTFAQLADGAAGHP